MELLFFTNDMSQIYLFLKSLPVGQTLWEQYNHCGLKMSFDCLIYNQ